MRKTLHVVRHDPGHGHGMVIHQEPEPLRGGTEQAHALAVLDEFLEPGFEPSQENLLRVYEALIRVVKDLVAHTMLTERKTDGT